MARIKSSTFQGAAPSEVDVGSPSWMRTIKNALADLALIRDKVTGLNSETEVITHDGTRGRGARLGFPWVNQSFSGRNDRRGQWGIDLGYTMAPSASSKSDGGVGDDTIVFGCPVFVPPGETDITVRITGRGLATWPWRVELRAESDGSILFQRGMTVSQDRSGLFDVASVSSSDNGTEGAGVLCLLLVYADTTRRQQTTGSSPDGQVRAYSLFAGPTRMRRGSGGRIARSSVDFNFDTSTAPFTWTDFDAALFEARAPLSSYLTALGAQNMNALAEYVTSFPVGGNSEFTLEDSGATDPATSRFLAHTQSTLSTEPAVALPIMAQAFGSCMLDGHLTIDGVPAFSGMLDWHGLIPLDTTESQLARWRLMMPDFPEGSGVSKLKACVLAISDNMTHGVQWESSWFSADGFGESPAEVAAATAFAQVGSTKMVTAKHTEIASFGADSASFFDVRVGKDGTAKDSVDELCVLGACLYFEP